MMMMMTTTTMMMMMMMIMLTSFQQVLFFHVALPMYIRHKIMANVDGTGTRPYHFRAFMPTGPACR
jgi:type IV secretory pathway VirB3-like protein